MAKSGNKPAEKDVKYCLRLLSICPRTEKELQVKLAARGCSAEDAGRIIGFLKKERFVDDQAFAREWIESRMRSNPRSRAALEHELAKKGVHPEVITNVFSGMEDVLDEKETALSLARRKLFEARMKKGDSARAKLYRYLAGKGFAEETVEDVVRELLGDHE